MVRPVTLSVSLLVTAVALATTSSRPRTQSGPEFGVTDLGTLGGGSTQVYGITPHAFPFVAGVSTTASGAQHAFMGNVWELRDLGTLGGQASVATAVNGGNAVGYAQRGNGSYHAFLHDFRTMHDLGTLGGSSSRASALNDDGTVVGQSLKPGDLVTRPFIYQSGTLSELPATLGGNTTTATDINNFGDIVGNGTLPNGSAHGYLFANGVTRDLTPSAAESNVFAINDSGVIVGHWRVGSGTLRAFTYANGAAHDLGTLGGTRSTAYAINNGGTIVGWSETSSGAERAVIWRNGTITDLNTLIRPGTGWVLQQAWGISDTGAIAGRGVLNGAARSFLLTPPLDLVMTLGSFNIGTNFPNPHEAGETLFFGVTVSSPGPHSATGVTTTSVFSGPVEIISWTGGDCLQDGLRVTCQLAPIDFDREVLIRARSTDAGIITHSASISGDQPDPNLSNNSGSESNTAVSLAAFSIEPTKLVGGKIALGRATLTSPVPMGGGFVPLTSSEPAAAPVPSNFGVLPNVNGGLFREFNLRTNPVSAPTTALISATYGVDTITLPVTVMPAGSQWPFRDVARMIPGVIQAEDFDEGGEDVGYHDTTVNNEGGSHRSTDVDIEPTADSGGGYNVGWINAGEWLEYTVNVASAGTYTLEARVASPSGGGTLHVELDGINKTGAMIVPATGGWQSWTTMARSVMLPAGTHVLKISFDTAVSGAICNLNLLRFVAAPNRATPFGGAPHAIPGIVQAENFDEGGEGIAFHDTTAVNSGGRYRSTAVDIEATTDVDGGFNVGWMTASEWLAYTVSVPQSGTYTLTARVASNGDGGRFHVEFGGVNATGPMVIPNTGGWQRWTDVSTSVSLNAGVQQMRFVADSNSPANVFGNLNHLALSAISASVSDVVLYASDFTLNGAWSRASDASAAGAQVALTPDQGWSTPNAPLSDPVDYVEASFNAAAGVPHAIWLRLRATGDTKFSESVWIQFSDAQAAGQPAFSIGSTSALLVNLEDCRDCGVSGWGWQNGAYWLAQPARLSFTTSGPHTIRIQVREDGAQIDQVVLSPSKYLNNPPGALRDDQTVVGK
jgi:probable HAF family extracellular repeat protein